jgi:hypothetical protein
MIHSLYRVTQLTVPGENLSKCNTCLVLRPRRSHCTNVYMHHLVHRYNSSYAIFTTKHRMQPKAVHNWCTSIFGSNYQPIKKRKIVETLTSSVQIIECISVKSLTVLNLNKIRETKVESGLESDVITRKDCNNSNLKLCCGGTVAPYYWSRTGRTGSSVRLLRMTVHCSNFLPRSSD